MPSSQIGTPKIWLGTSILCVLNWKICCWRIHCHNRYHAKLRITKRKWLCVSETLLLLQRNRSLHLWVSQLCETDICSLNPIPVSHCLNNFLVQFTDFFLFIYFQMTWVGIIYTIADWSHSHFSTYGRSVDWPVETKPLY